MTPTKRTCGLVMAAALLAVVGEGLCQEAEAVQCSGSQVVELTVPDYPIYKYYEYMYVGTTYEFDTRNLSANGDTVMRVFRWESSIPGIGSTVEVAVDDDSGYGLGSRVVVQPTVTGWYIIAVHAYDTQFKGSAEFWADGVLKFQNINFGGWRIDTQCSMYPGDEFHTLNEPDGYALHQLLVATGTGGSPAVKYHDNNTMSYGTGVQYTHTGTPSQSYIVYTGGGYGVGDEITVAINGKSNDSDGDGVGDVLEEALRTCPDEFSTTADGWDCSTYDSGDTDNDGLSDYWEVFGAESGGGVVALRAWGANPTRKDAFFEVDHIDHVKHNNGALFSWFLTIAARLHTHYSAPGGPTGQFGLAINNPDQSPGVALHFDIDQATPIDLGNDRRFIFDGGGSGSLNGLPCKGRDADDVLNYVNRRADSMSVPRRAAFHYICMDSSAGQSAGTPHLSMYASDSFDALTHELGHNLGLGHGGDNSVNCKPNYLSFMNYCFTEVPAGRIRVAGEPSQLSAGDIGVPINPALACETQPFGSNPTSGDLTHISAGWVMAGSGYHDLDVNGLSVDWNLDGDMTDCPVRAPVTDTWQTTGATAVERSKIDEEDLANSPTGTPALARAASSGAERLYLVLPAVYPAAMTYRYMDFPGECPEPASAACGTWSSEYSTGWYGSDIAATRFTRSGVQRVYVVARRPHENNDVSIFEGTIGAQGTLSFAKVYRATGASAEGTPEIYAATKGKLYVAWRKSDSTLSVVTMDSNGSWSSPVVVSDGTQKWTSEHGPAIRESREGGAFTSVYMLRTAPGGQLDFLHESGGLWLASSSYNIPVRAMSQASGKPALAWTTFDGASQGVGYWDILYTGTGGYVEHLRFGSGVDRTTKLLNTWYDTAPPYGVAVSDVPEDSSFHTAIWLGSDIDVLPYADGMPDFQLNDNDDFGRMGAMICRAFEREGRGCGDPAGALLPLDNEASDCEEHWQ